MTTTIDGETRFWCSQGAFEFPYVPEDYELDFEYIKSICSDFDDMSAEDNDD